MPLFRKGGVVSVNSKTGSAIVLNQDDVADGTVAKQYTEAEETKLAGISPGATVNSSDASLVNRANHTGTQPQSSIENLSTDLGAKASIVYVDSLFDGLVWEGTQTEYDGSVHQHESSG